MTNLFSKPKAPAVTPPSPMPDPEVAGSEAAAMARRDVLARAGRASTILTGPSGRQKAPAAATQSYDTFAGKTLGA